MKPIDYYLYFFMACDLYIKCNNLFSTTIDNKNVIQSAKSIYVSSGCALDKIRCNKNFVSTNVEIIDSSHKLIGAFYGTKVIIDFYIPDHDHNVYFKLK